MILFIASIDNDGPFSRFRKLKTSEMLPFGRAALTIVRPSGSLSTVIFSPGRTPRCFRKSLRSVTCPLAVIVSVLMPWPHVQAIQLRQRCLKIKQGRRGADSLGNRKLARIVEIGRNADAGTNRI